MMNWLQHHFSSGAKNAQYIDHNIQNELIAEIVVCLIVTNCKEAVIFHETKDISNVEQVSQLYIEYCIQKALAWHFCNTTLVTAVRSARTVLSSTHLHHNSGNFEFIEY